MSLFCKYRHIFGEPNTGIHKQRFLNLAIWDVIPTIIFIVLLSFFAKIPLQHSVVYVLIAMIVFHRLFCVRTVTDKLLFP